LKRIQRQIILITITLLFIITTCCTVSAAKIDNDTQLSANTSISPVNTSVVISGTVKRCSNGDNFQGVTVTAFKNGVKLASTTTKADGTYTLGFKSADKVFTVTASYPGHKSASRTVTVNNNSIG
jgi:acyl-CoA thioesterase